MMLRIAGYGLPAIALLHGMLGPALGMPIDGAKEGAPSAAPGQVVVLKRMAAIQQVLLDSSGKNIGSETVLVEVDENNVVKKGAKPVRPGDQDAQRAFGPDSSGRLLPSDTMARTDPLQAIGSMLTSGDPRYPGMLEGLSALERSGGRNLVELGTSPRGTITCPFLMPSGEQGDGCPTRILGAWAELVKGRLTSVDPDEQAIGLARVLSDTAGVTSFVGEAPELWVKKHNSPIDLLYVSNYRRERDPRVRGESALADLMTVYTLLTGQAVVMVDECPTLEDPGCAPIAQTLKAGGWEELTNPNAKGIVLRTWSRVPRGGLKIGWLDAMFAGLIDAGDLRYATVRKAAELAANRQAKVFVETGTSRGGHRECAGDGCSTLLWGRFVHLVGGILHTIDINPEYIEEARQASAVLADRISYHVQDSVRFLSDFGQKIDLLYLDSYDFDAEHPMPSQMHHLKEILAAYDKLHSRSVVIIDDCGLVHEGKCKLVHSFLEYAGWTMVASAYQRVYVKEY